MAKEFFERLRAYYGSVATVLRGESDVASIFGNSSDIGSSREQVYAEFLRRHVPSKCNVFLGGFLFHDEDGSESKQLDVIITTDTTPRYNFYNPNGHGKSFSPVEGTLAVASIKSTLDRKQLFIALDGIASIPSTRPLDERTSFGVKIQNYDDWPYKIIFASRGIAAETLYSHLTDYYTLHPEVPVNRRPQMIHVAGKYVIARKVAGLQFNSIDGCARVTENGSFRVQTRFPDLHGISSVLHELQIRATASTQIFFNYSELLNRMF